MGPKQSGKFFSGEIKHIFAASPEAAEYVFPSEEMSEVAFIGRSNVGKSSLLNAVMGRRSLARTSKTPGATRALHFYDVCDAFHLVDLPGYGYAALSKTMARKIHQLVDVYLQQRRNLKKVYVLVDARHGLKDADEKLMKSLLEWGIPFSLILTKIDKVKKTALEKEIATTRQVVPDALILPTSAEKKEGVDELRRDILEVCGIVSAQRR